MQENLAFNILTYTDNDSTFPKPANDNYDYWISLVGYFLAKSDTIEIHCWNEEIETIEEIQSLQINKVEMIKEENITVFNLKKTHALSDYLLKNNLNRMGEFKWFTINLYNGLVSVIHSGHWGTEFFVPNATGEDIVFIKSVTPPETSFLQFE